MRAPAPDRVPAPLRLVRNGVVVVTAFVAGVVAGAAVPPPAVSPAGATAAAVTTSWATKQRTLADGRTFYARVPTCRPVRSPGCRAFLRRDRAVVIFLHGATGAEDRATATGWLGGLHAIDRDTIFVYGVSKNGSRRWDAGFCCTPRPVDDVGYLTRVVNDIARRWEVDHQRIGAMGLSNGGMLALRAICERPKRFAAAVALAGTYDGPCDAGRTRIAQWHGGRDATVPLNGGPVVLDGEQHELPPVASLAQRMAPGSVYQLRVLPNRGHAMAWAQFREATRWLVAHLPA